LRRRERSIAEIANWLRERDYPGEEIEQAVGELIECGELDDERFAALFAEDKRELSGWGPERIAAALRERGLDRALIDRVTEEDHAAQLERAAALLQTRALPLGEPRERERALGLLTRRGFDYELAHDAIRHAAEAAASGEAGEAGEAA
jgi:regulatory protein